MNSSLLAAALVLLSALPGFAQEAAAVLMVEDNSVTEDLGLAAYTPFLTRSGAYRKVWKLKGSERSNERLARAIRAAAAEYDVVDVFVSVHTTSRPVGTMTRLIPVAARKLRLVYSTACYGADVEREAWEALGARTVVTHVGVNNPLVALPYFLSRWIQGAPVRTTIREGYREESITSRFVISLPGADELFNRLYPSNGRPAFFAGSRPVLSGEGGLTVRSGVSPLRLTQPEHLRYRRQDGASIGLALRAMAGNYTLEGAGLREVFGALQLPAMPFVSTENLRRIRVLPVYQTSSYPGAAWASGGPRLVAGKVEATFSQSQEIPLEQGFKLKLSKRITVTPGRVDPGKRELRLETTGIWVARGLLRYRVTSMTIKPDGEGYQVTVGGGAWGVIPYWHSLPIGGRRPEALPKDLSILDAGRHEARVGIASMIGRAPTQR